MNTNQTDLEVFRATVEHRRPERILFRASFTPDLEKRLQEHIGTKDIARHYGMFESVELWPHRPAGVKELDFSKYWQGEKLVAGTTINDDGVAMVPSGFYHFWGYISPLRNATSLREIEEYPRDDMSNWDFSYMRPAVEKAHAAGRVVTAWAGPHMYETAWQIRGYEQFLMDMIEQPAWAECLLERIFQQNLIFAKAAAAAGADMLGTGDDVANQNAMMFSPAVWRDMMLSRWRKVWQAAKEIKPDIKVWYHTDGNVLPIVGDMVEAGLDILNPLQPEALDIDEVHRRYGTRLSFDGCIGTQSTMPWGKPADVEARVREIIDKYGQSGGLMISPTHVLEPEVPLANIDALCAACRKYGQLR